jgi:predicted MPP superfamily phosphohydrolase
MKVTSPSLAPLWKDKKIVLFSDTHLGLVRGEQFTKKVAEMVNAQKPDLVLMAGDMIDGPAIPYERFSAPFKDIICHLWSISTHQAIMNGTMSLQKNLLMR